MTRKDLVAHVVGLLALGVIATICFMSFAHAETLQKTFSAAAPHLLVLPVERVYTEPTAIPCDGGGPEGCPLPEPVLTAQQRAQQRALIACGKRAAAELEPAPDATEDELYMARAGYWAALQQCEIDVGIAHGFPDH
jgi:hypothetical protein